MVFIRTRSGRYINLNHIVGFAVEYEKIELNGRNIQVFEVIAYLPQPLLPAVLGIYSTEEKAEEYLNKLVESILKTKTGVVSLETEI
ncbi:MAG: hypothetical protein N2Z80_04300 [Hydrogenothermaceae bacterium]|nr:hypothetical protein [Hydrogenothermaceae bacterium]